MRLEILTQGALTKLSTCEELFRLRYLEGLTSPTTKPAFTIGSAVHAGLEHADPDVAVEVLRRKRGPAYSQEERDDITRQSGIVRGMVSGALAVWGGRLPEKREVRFEVPLRNPQTGARSTAHNLSGVIDGVFGDGSIQELKTTSRLDRDYIARLDIDFQLTTYLACASDYFGVPYRTAVYRIIRKPSIRQTQKETPEDFASRVEADYRDRPDFYFAETTIHRTDADIERWRWEVWRMHERVLELERGGFPIRNTRACLDYGRCDYFDLCTGQSGPDAFHVLDDVYPELAEQSAEENT
jgi:hypothetical protein